MPNFSEGRDMGVIKQITSEIESTDGVRLLDVDPGEATNRTVVTFVGEPEAVVEAAFKAVRKARRDFKAMRSGYDKARAENMKLAVTTRIPEVLKSSILYKYYLGFKHTYSSLK